MSPSNPNIIFGAAGIASESIEGLERYLKILETAGINKIDTAEAYGKSEELLGQLNATSRFNIDTKLFTALGPVPTKDIVINRGKESLKRLNTNNVDVYYIHAPDPRCSFETMLAGIDALYRDGAFKRFGLSNFLPHEVEEVIRICNQQGFVLPSVFQGNYSAVARRPDSELFPILRKHNIAFYAYSPIAGGFLTKTREMFTNSSGTGRWDPNSFAGKLYSELYNKPSLLDGLDAWGEIATEEGISKAELAYRWVAWNSSLRADLGDGIVFGASTESQAQETVDWIRKGPLSMNAAQKIDGVWEMVRGEAIVDNFNSYLRGQL